MIDNKKMWESIIADFKSQFATNTLTYAAIINALKIQGFEYKDGEIMPIEKIHEPKFKVGDWLVHKDLVGVTCCITQIHAPHYYLTNNNSFIKFGEEDNYRPWTIEDAKDGDVLATSAGAFIYNGNNGGGSCPGCYCGIDTLGRFKTGVEHHWTGGKVYPATREQCEQLEKAIADAGYVWFPGEKELKKIDGKPAVEWSKDDEQYLLVCKNALSKYQVSDKWDAGIISRWLENRLKSISLQPKPEWSEEDDKMLNLIIGDYERGNESWMKGQNSLPFGHRILWLKSLKDRVLPQPMQEWSEEDEANFQCVLSYVNSNPLLEDVNVENRRTWLKSLKDRYTWKPSEEMLEALESATENCAYSEYQDCLRELIGQLKKLK